MELIIDRSKGFTMFYNDFRRSDTFKSLDSRQRDILTTLISMVNHKRKIFDWNGEKITCNRGETVTSLSKIAYSCAKDITRYHVKYALEKFKSLGILSFKIAKSYTHLAISPSLLPEQKVAQQIAQQIAQPEPRVTISDEKSFQENKNPDCTPDCTPDSPQLNKYKKEDKNIKKKKINKKENPKSHSCSPDGDQASLEKPRSKKSLDQFSPEAHRLCKYFAREYKNIVGNSGYKIPTTDSGKKTWLTYAERILKQYSQPEAEAVITFAAEQLKQNLDGVPYTFRTEAMSKVHKNFMKLSNAMTHNKNKQNQTINNKNTGGYKTVAQKNEEFFAKYSQRFKDSEPIVINPKQPTDVSIFNRKILTPDKVYLSSDIIDDSTNSLQKEAKQKLWGNPPQNTHQTEQEVAC